MADAAIGTFPTIRNVLESGDNIKSYTVGGTIAVKAGMVLAFHGTGVSRTVHAAVNGTTVLPAGVALYDAAIGAQVAVAENGCNVYVANARTELAIESGDMLIDNANAIGGTVGAATLTTVGTTLVYKYRAGYAIDGIAGNSTGVMKVDCGITPVGSA